VQAAISCRAEHMICHAAGGERGAAGAREAAGRRRGEGRKTLVRPQVQVSAPINAGAVLAWSRRFSGAHCCRRYCRRRQPCLPHSLSACYEQALGKDNTFSFTSLEQTTVCYTLQIADMPPMEYPDSSSGSSGGGSGGVGSGEAKAEAPPAPAPEEIADVLQGLAAEQQRAEAGGSNGNGVSPTGSAEAAATALREAAEAAEQRGESVFAHPKSESSSDCSRRHAVSASAVVTKWGISGAANQRLQMFRV